MLGLRASSFSENGLNPSIKSTLLAQGPELVSFCLRFSLGLRASSFSEVGLNPSIKSTLLAQGPAFFVSFLIKASFIRVKQKSPLRTEVDFFCDSAGIRTQGPYIKSVLLYQLSYGIADLRVQIYRIFSFYNCYLGNFGCF